MKKAIVLALLGLSPFTPWARLPSHTLTICQTIYTVSPSVFEGRNDLHYYRLTLATKGAKDRRILIGAYADQYSRTRISQALKDSLHRAELFASCPGEEAATFRSIEDLITSLVRDLFPLVQVKLVAEQVINRNNKLRLLQEGDDGPYQLANSTPSGEVVLLSYDSGLHQYNMDWKALIASKPVLDNFDLFLSLYKQIPAAEVKPQLFLWLQPKNGDYQLVYLYSGNTAIDPGVTLDKAVVSDKHLAGAKVGSINVNSWIAPDLYKTGPSDDQAPKQSKDAPLFKEQH